MFGVVACFAVFYIATAFALGYGTGALGHSRAAFLGVQLIAIPFMAAGIVIAGWWSDRASPRTVLLWGCAATIGVGLLTAPLLGGTLASAGLYLCLAMSAMGLVYGPLGAWLPGIFPARVRYTGSSIAFNLGGVIGGGLTPYIAQSMAGRGLWPVGLFLVGAGALSALGILLAGRTGPGERAL